MSKRWIKPYKNVKGKIGALDSSIRHGSVNLSFFLSRVIFLSIYHVTRNVCELSFLKGNEHNFQ